MKWIKQEKNFRIPIKSWCADVEDGAMRQAANLASHPALAQHVALMPDCHQGYGMPIGGVVAAKDAVIPSAVGVDIGCGMTATETDVPAERISDMALRRAIQEKLKLRIPVGDGVSHSSAQKWEGFEERLDESGEESVGLIELDRMNLGTLGGGNHFIEIQKSDSGFVWLMIHSGSRNLGKRIEEFHHAKARVLNERYRVRLPDFDLAFLPIQEPQGRNYFQDMLFALRYAKENRRRMMQTLKETFLEFVPEASFLQEIDIHHNYAAFETHFGETYCIHRKGATSAKLNEVGIIPGSMGSASYIVRGLGNPESFMSCSHGAGRRMSRNAACRTLTEAECDAAMEGILCESWKPCRSFGKTRGMLDFSEAPQAYKPIDEVIEAERDLIEPATRLTPLAVLKG